MKTKPRSSPKVHELAGLILGAGDEMRASFEDVCARYGLTAPQARALLALKEDAPMRSLANHLRCDPSNITGIADRLQARGLVRRAEGEQDRRVTLLTLTAKGKKIRDDVERSVISASPVMANLTPEERQRLADLLRKLIAGSR